MWQLYIAYGVIYAFVLIIGICIGSFSNVLIYRIPAGESFIKGRSHCTSCGHTLCASDLVPVVSYITLGGRCRYCDARISPRYAIVELLGGALAVCSALAFGLTWHAVMCFVCSCILMIIAWIDIDTMEIPNELNVTLFVLAAVSFFWFKDITWLSAVIGIFEISLPMLLMNLIIKDSFGGGDIKLCAGCGALLGWQNMLAAAFIALIVGGAYGAWLLISKKKDRKAHFAFGPFLSFGIIVSMMWGNIITNAYLSLFL